VAAKESDEQRASRIAFEERQTSERKKRKDAQNAEFAAKRAQLSEWLHTCTLYHPSMSLTILPGLVTYLIAISYR
jgi:hypothetical protein